MPTHAKSGGNAAPAKATALPVLVKAAPLPPLPLVLVDASFAGHLATLGDQIKVLRIVGPEDAQTAAKLLTEVTLLEKQLEKCRKEAKQPFLDMGRNIDTAAKTPSTALDAMKTAVKSRMAAWDAEQRRIAAEAESARQAELARLEAEKQREEDEARRKAEELAKTLPAEDVLDFEFDESAPTEEAPKSEIDKQIEAVKYAPAVAPAAAPAGITYRTYLRYAVTDVNALPEQFVTRSANMNAIREAFVVGYKDGDPVPTLPGVKFSVDRVPVSTGRAGMF